MRAGVDSQFSDDHAHAVESPTQTIRAWLVNGTRRLAVDPRRRAGRHTQARRLLTTDEDAVNGPARAWGGLVSALQRHTVHSELARLPRSDRHILSLAYVQGHTNREIAAMLHVSVRTVSRRLAAALGRLEESVLRAGAWISGLALLGLAAYARWVVGPRSNRWSSTVAMAATGTATAFAVGIAVANPDLAEATASPAPAAAMPIVLSMSMPLRSFAAVTTVVVDLDTADGTAKTKAHAGGPSQRVVKQPKQTTARGGHGNPTNGSRGRSDRTHPEPGGGDHKA